MGLAMGMSLDEIKSVMAFVPLPGQPMVYQASTVPKPLPGFEKYILVVSPTTGLCKVNAIGESYDTDVYGMQAHKKFDELKAALSEKYGKPSIENDLLMPGSIWNDGKDWLMALRKKERFLSVGWVANPAHPLPYNLEAVSVDTSVELRDRIWFTLVYEFETSSACIKEAEKARNASF